MPDDREASSPRPKLSEIGLVGSVCPYCDEPLARRPERKTVCPHCGSAIFVRRRPLDRQRVLLTEQQVLRIEAEWTALQVWSKRRRGGRTE